MISLLIALCGCGTKTDDSVKLDEEKDTSVDEKNQNSDSEEVYPKIICIDSSLYYGTDEKCEVIPRKAPDGIIETFIEKEIMPDADGVANFGAEQGSIEYMFLEDGSLIVHIGEEWYYFEKRGEDHKIADFKTYEFQTYDGSTISIDDKNIISQEKVEDVLENTIVPSDAEIIAPGRDYVYLADSKNYYVEDSVEQLLTIAKKKN